MSETETTPAKELSELKINSTSNGDAKPAANEEASPSPTPSTGCLFKDSFRAFSKFGDTKSDGKLITLSQSDKWMKQAKVIDGKKITTTDTGIYFKKLKSLKVNIEDYKKFLDDLAKNKKVEVEEMKTKMSSCGLPGHSGTGVCIELYLLIHFVSFYHSYKLYHQAKKLNVSVSNRISDVRIRIFSDFLLVFN